MPGSEFVEFHSSLLQHLKHGNFYKKNLQEQEIRRQNVKIKIVLYIKRNCNILYIEMGSLNRER
jgi:hypothetical protein